MEWFVWIGSLALIMLSSLFALAHIGYWSASGHPQTVEESFADYQDRLTEQQMLKTLDRPWTFLGYYGLVANGIGLMLLITHPDLRSLLWLILLGNVVFQSLSFAYRIGGSSLLKKLPTLSTLM